LVIGVSTATEDDNILAQVCAEHHAPMERKAGVAEL
jgi:hypothetical protein